VRVVGRSGDRSMPGERKAVTAPLPRRKARSGNPTPTLDLPLPALPVRGQMETRLGLSISLSPGAMARQSAASSILEISGADTCG
jgi:hypothetical protein